MATSWQVGNRIRERWEVLKILRGGMGVVYVVFDHEFQELLAAKTFQDAIFQDDPHTASRFLQEANAWINLDRHPNVVHARFVETIEGKPFLFLEYLMGGDLRRLIGTPQLVNDIYQVLRFAIHFCDGMSHALSQGIKAHRDIKPDNCLLTLENFLQVTDFGLAKVLLQSNEIDQIQSGPVRNAPQRAGLLSRIFGFGGSSSASHTIGRDAHTKTGTVLGTPHYMAPEQFGDAKRVDIRADMYSFGVMLYEMVKGERPFAGRTYVELEHQHRTKQPASLNRTPQLDELVQQCLAKAPEHRPSSFSDVRAQLVAMYKGITGTEMPSPRLDPVDESRALNTKGFSLRAPNKTQGMYGSRSGWRRAKGSLDEYRHVAHSGPEVGAVGAAS